MEYLRAGSAYFRSLDFEGATMIARELGWGVFSAAEDTAEAFRQTLERLIRGRQPPWALLIPSGRQVLRQAIDDPDLWQCFHIAALDDESEEAVSWWDALAKEVRARGDERRLARGRIAERKSLRREAALLANTSLEPKWVALDDNRLGYDIGSWRFREVGEPRSHAIEVKSSLEGLSFYLSAREWQVALDRGDAWEMHVWVSHYTRPVILMVHDLLPNMPTDHGQGRWVSTFVDMTAEQAARLAASVEQEQ